ncbi:hypothetical protein, partial [Oceanospirillum multiglobuliferum]
PAHCRNKWSCLPVLRREQFGHDDAVPLGPPAPRRRAPALDDVADQKDRYLRRDAAGIPAAVQVEQPRLLQVQIQKE